MRFPLTFWLLALTAGSALVDASALAQGTTAEPRGAFQTARPLTIEPVGENLYVISGEGGNVAVLTSPQGVLLVDNMFERNHADMLAAVASVTDQAIRYVLNTHQHDDHAGGTRMLLPFSSVIAHDNVRTNLKAIRQPYYEDTPGLPVGLPQFTFPQTASLSLGNDTAVAYRPGRGHTNGDSVVYFLQQRTIHTGDLFIARGSLNIYADYAQGGSLSEWVETIDAILTLDFDTVIPGHGPMATRADVVAFRGNLATMVERLRSLIESGATKAQLATILETDYGWRSTGCPPSPPTPGCLQYQQLDSLIAELTEQ